MYRLYQLVLLAVIVTTSAAPNSNMRFRRDDSDEVSFMAGPTGTFTSDSTTPTVPPASENPNEVLFGTIVAQRGQLGGSVLGPNNIPIVLQNPDLLAPPTTDSGSVYVYLALVIDLF